MGGHDPGGLEPRPVSSSRAWTPAFAPHASLTVRLRHPYALRQRDADLGRVSGVVKLLLVRDVRSFIVRRQILTTAQFRRSVDRGSPRPWQRGTGLRWQPPATCPRRRVPPRGILLRGRT